MQNKNLKKVLVLGGSSDIGVSIIKIYLRNNYKVIAHYNKTNKNLKKLVKINKNLKLIKFNFMTSLKKIEKFLDNKEFKDCSVFINALGHIKEVAFEKLKLSDIDNVIKVNFYPSVYFTKIIGPEMNKRKWGRIVNLGSIGVKFGGGNKNFPYSFSKHALEFIPTEIKKWNINNVLVNTIRVGVTDTKLHQKLKSKNMRKRKMLIPMKRIADTVEIAEFVYFLGSEKNTYISNQVLSISGGE